MLAYTVKLNVQTCHLLYPATLKNNNKLGTHYEITHNNNDVASKVFYHRLPTMITNGKEELSQLIEKKEEELRGHLIKIVYGNTNET